MFAEHKSSLDKALTNPTKTTPPSRVLDRAKSTGIWLSIVPMHTTNSVLSSLEFRDALHLRYGLTPTNLPTHCDGCQTPFTIGHALTCKKGGLVTLRHNELRDELKAIATTIFPPSAIRVEPFIHPAQPHTNALPPPTLPNHSSTSSLTPNSPPPTFIAPPNDMRGDLSIRGLKDRARDCIIDVSISDLDSQVYKSKTATAVLRSREKDKNRKYSSTCNYYRRDFIPFIASADGLLGLEATELLQLLSAKLAEKWNRPYPPVRGYINARISFALIRASHLCIRGSRHMSTSPTPDDDAVDVVGPFHLLHS